MKDFPSLIIAPILSMIISVLMSVVVHLIMKKEDVVETTQIEEVKSTESDSSSIWKDIDYSSNIRPIVSYSNREEELKYKENRSIEVYSFHKNGLAAVIRVYNHDEGRKGLQYNEKRPIIYLDSEGRPRAYLDPRMNGTWRCYNKNEMEEAKKVFDIPLADIDIAAKMIRSPILGKVVANNPIACESHGF